MADVVLLLSDTLVQWLAGLVIVLLAIMLVYQKMQQILSRLQNNNEHLSDVVMRLAESHYDSLTSQLSVMQDRQLSSERHLNAMLIKINGSVIASLSGMREGLLERFSELNADIVSQVAQSLKEQASQSSDLKILLEQSFSAQRAQLDGLTQKQIKLQQEMLSQQMKDVSRELGQSLQKQTDQIDSRLKDLTKNTDQRLQDIAGQVEKRLNDGFDKTTDVFRQVLQHLSQIDQAQKKITELSSNVVSLQEILSDKRSRGAFGEVQLSALIGNLMPEQNYELQATLSNGKRVDCLLKLPEPTGNVAIDSKFPLESYKRLMDDQLPEVQRNVARRQFKADVQKHIDDIANKYLIAGETADGAVMFIPAEAIFAELHAHYPEIIERAHQKRVWLTSPTTIMAILTTARAVIKDEKTREQVHLIQMHLNKLSKDFTLFQGRMDKLAKHIQQANRDVEEVNVSARKISGRFGQVERVELD